MAATRDAALVLIMLALTVVTVLQDFPAFAAAFGFMAGFGMALTLIEREAD